MSKLTRTFEIGDIAARELAEVFADQFSDFQAQFFHELHDISKKWPGAGWCQQCCSISEELTPQAQEIIAKLAEWSAAPYRRPATEEL